MHIQRMQIRAMELQEQLNASQIAIQEAERKRKDVERRMREEVKEKKELQQVVQTAQGERELAEKQLKQSEERREEAERKMQEALKEVINKEEKLQQVVQRAEKEKEQGQLLISEAEKKKEEAERRMEEVMCIAEKERELAQRETKEAQKKESETRKFAESEREQAQLLIKRTIEEAESRIRQAEQTAANERQQRDQAQMEREMAEKREREARQEAEREREVAEREREQTRLNRKRAEEAEAEARELGMQWIVRRREIQLTNVELGRGGWGAVTVANFRGIQVAAKCLHKELISDYYQHMFNREMNMAARLRHPNLVQFIGASIEGHPIILTELMKTSLRTELEKNNIQQLQVKSISLDVAQALNYLHLMQPHPIIHRDISSANVLLDSLSDNYWKAKISDYGSVNLQQQLRTENPGSPVYSAPEANSPALQSPKMDIFSFGVLLVEMLTSRFPEISSRQRLIASIDHAGYLALIQQCLSEEREQRPSAEKLISTLDEF